MINDRKVVSELFSTIVEKVGNRPGGYTRIVRLGQRLGDGAEVAVIELVDFNTGSEITGRAEGKKKSSQARKGASKKAGARKEKPAPAAADTAAAPAVTES